MASEIAHSNKASYEAIDNAPYDKVYLLDIFNFKITIDEIVAGANRVARGEKSLWHHPKLKQVIILTQDETLRLAAAGMASKAFGNLSVPVFATVDEAMEYIRANP